VSLLLFGAAVVCVAFAIMDFQAYRTVVSLDGESMSWGGCGLVDAHGAHCSGPCACWLKIKNQGKCSATKQYR
jgi:hypothetical protein